MTVTFLEKIFGLLNGRKNSFEETKKKKIKSASKHFKILRVNIFLSSL